MLTPDPDELEEQPIQDMQLGKDLDHLTGRPCRRCARPICGHEALFSIASGFKNAPRCLNCLARDLNREVIEFRDYCARYIRHRNCFNKAWRLASEREGFGPDEWPTCLGTLRSVEPSGSRLPDEVPTETGTLITSSSWDAGDMGCGDLVLALRGRLLSLPPGAVLRVTARDPAAPVDLPAWCRLTGHRLVRASHPEYFIQRKEP